MAFAYRWMFENDISDTSDRFSRKAGEQFARNHDFDGRCDLASSLWGELQSLGWPCLMIDEAIGGIGGELHDLAAILEGAGKYALPLPLLAAFGIAPMLINAAAEGGAQLAAGLIGGEIVAIPAIEGVGRRARGKVGQIEYRQDGEQLVLTGRQLGVEAVPLATHVLFAARCPEGPADEAALILCPVDAPGLTLASARRMDGRASIDLALDRVALPLAALIAAGSGVAKAVDGIADIGALLTSVETVAAMGSLIAETIDYLTVRKQFNVPLGSFQVLRHYVADMVAAYEVTHALLLHTLRQVESGNDVSHSEAISLLRIRVSAAGGLVARQAIQLHGGMGMTEELLATRLARRIMMAEFEYGDGAFHADRLLALRGNQA